MANNHDNHYRELESLGLEPVKIMESMMLRRIPKELHAQVLLNYRNAQAVGYELRCGMKDGADPAVELEKAQNWNERGKTGKWREV